MSHKPIDLEWGWVRIQYGPDNSVEKDLPLKEKDNLKNRKVGELVEEIFSNAKFASSIGLASESDPLQWTIHEVKQKDRRAPEELREVCTGMLNSPLGLASVTESLCAVRTGKTIWCLSA